VFYVFHGDDDLGCSEELARLRKVLAEGDPAMAELNTSILDGKQLSMGELRHTCDTIPFLADRRLVIVHGLLSRLASDDRARRQQTPRDNGPTSKQTFLEDLAAYLPTLPPTTRLIFVEEEALPVSHPILQVARAEEKNQKGFSKLFKKPKDHEVAGWIRERTQAKGGIINREAASILAALVGNNTRLLDQEIDKLLLYVDGRQIDADDVQTLVSHARQMSIFDLVDCVGRRQADRALQLLHHMLDSGEAPLYLLSMLARQIRILIQVNELRAQGFGSNEMAKRLKLHPYVVEKGLAQAQNFTMTQLESAHESLVATDMAIKTGQIEDILALDMLVVALTTV
jgi:DNA polymerase-3 subunit delta